MRNKNYNLNCEILLCFLTIINLEHTVTNMALVSGPFGISAFVLMFITSTNTNSAFQCEAVGISAIMFLCFSNLYYFSGKFPVLSCYVPITMAHNVPQDGFFLFNFTALFIRKLTGCSQSTLLLPITGCSQSTLLLPIIWGNKNVTWKSEIEMSSVVLVVPNVTRRSESINI